MKIIVAKNSSEASLKAFEIMQNYLKPGNVLGLATGSTPIELYKLMVDDHRYNDTDYRNIKTYNLDEYVGLAKDHRESYYSFMHTHLFDWLNIKEENIHIPCGIGDLAKNCKDYDAMLEKDKIDIQLLGIGADGHIGFNEPGTSFSSTTHIAELTAKTREDNGRFFQDLGEEVPTSAITMGIQSIMDAKAVLLLAFGENKAEAVKNMIEGPINEICPASILQKHPNCTVIVDESAGKLLAK